MAAMAARARAVAAGGRACSLSRRLPSHGSAGQTAPRNPVSVCGCRGSAGGGSGCAQQRHVRCRLKVRRHRRAGAIVAGSSVGRRYCGRPLRALPAHGRPLALPLLPAQPHRSHWERLHRDGPTPGASSAPGAAAACSFAVRKACQSLRYYPAPFSPGSSMCGAELLRA